jgi:microcystin degradation protein MlrC
MGIDAMKFVIAQMKHESHSFMPELVPLKAFNLFGEDMPFENERAVNALRGSNSGAAAFIDLAESIGADYAVPIVGEALPLGPTEDAAFEYMSGKIIAAVKKGCDAVLLDLHGSMTTPAYPDAEGELLQRIRRVAPDIPIAVALDFHCTLTPEMIDHSTVISIYRTTPHIDMYATGQRAAGTLLSHLKGACRAVMVARRIPLMANLERMGDQAPPMKNLIDLLHQMETEQPDILIAGLSGGHPFTDLAPGGMTAVLVTNDNPAAGQAAAENLLQRAWENREGLVYRAEPYRKSLEYAQSLDEGPIIMADSGDIPSSGGFGADMTVLKEAIAMGFEDMIVGPIFDPESAGIMFARGVGSEVTLALGGKREVPLMDYSSEPIKITGMIQAVSDRPISLTGPMLGGLTISLGQMAVLSTGTLDILVTEKRGEALDLGIFSHMGLDPHNRKYTLVKSRQHYKAAFAPIARHMMWVCGPGPTQPDFSGFLFQHINRPVFPLDRDTQYHLDKLGGW